MGRAHPLFSFPGARLGIERSGLVALQVNPGFVFIGLCADVSGTAGTGVADWQLAAAHVEINNARIVSRIALPPSILSNAHAKKYTAL
jgi:hypothetical protein